MQRCPDPTDGPSIIVGAIEDADRALRANPATPLPPACVLAAFAELRGVPDSIVAHALAIATELDRRGPASRELLSAEVMLLSQQRRYADVSKGYGRLTALDSKPAMKIGILALTAARQRADSTSLLRLVTTLAARGDAPAAMRTERTVLTQVKALRAAIDEARGLIRQNPKYVAGYPSLVGNFGTLGVGDSVVAYVRRAVGHGVSRATLTPAVETFVNASLRHTALYGSGYGWDAAIAEAKRVDAALSTTSTKFLVAALTVQSAEPEIVELNILINGASWLPRSTDPSLQAAAARTRAAGCQRVAAVGASLNVADAKLREGGARYAGGGVAQIASGLSAERSRLSELQAECSPTT